MFFLLDKKRGAPAARAFTPASISGLTAWYDFSDVSTLFTDSARTTAVTADGDAIGGVTDKSGNAAHLSASTTARPTYKTAIQNSKSIARFNGSANKLNGTIPTLANSAFSIFLVRKSSYDSGTRVVLTVGVDDVSYKHLHIKQSASGSESFDLYSYAAGATGLALNTFALYRFSQNSSKSLYYHRNGTQVTSNTANASFFTGTTDFRIGSYGPFDIQWFLGDIGEVLIYTGELSAGNVSSIETYLNARWSLF